MARACTICKHAARDAIDRDLAAGVPNRRIAAQRAVSEQALRRHRADHLPAALVRAQEAAEVATADTLLDQVRALQERALSILDRADHAGDLRTALGAIQQARGNLQLLAQLIGELANQPTVNLFVTAEWIQVRTTLLELLQPHPALRAELAARLVALGDGAGG